VNVCVLLEGYIGRVIVITDSKIMLSHSYSDYRQQHNVFTQLYNFCLFIQISCLNVCITHLLYVLLNKLHDIKTVLKLKYICYTTTFLTVFIVDCSG
jgi:hypothetical protein